MRNYPLQYALQSIKQWNFTYNQFHKCGSLLIQFILDLLTF